MVQSIRMVLVFAVMVAAAGQTQASMIDTTPSWNGLIAIQHFGEPGNATFGQTFTVAGPDTVMNSFTFWLNDFLNPDTVDFAAYVMAWNSGTQRATGPILYQSAPKTTTNNSGLNGMEQFTINTGSLALTSGQQYVAFFSTSNFFDGSFGTSSMGFTSLNPYSGGTFVFSGNGSNFPSLTSTGWSVTGADAAFIATFSAPDAAVPEPTSLALCGIGALGLMFGARRRRQQPVAAV